MMQNSLKIFIKTNFLLSAVAQKPVMSCASNSENNILKDFYKFVSNKDISNVFNCKVKRQSCRCA
jgi:hypothetical protein